GSPTYLSRHHVSRYQGLNHPASTFNKYKLRIESVLAEESAFIGEPRRRACRRDGAIPDGDLLEGLRCSSLGSDCRARRGNRKSPRSEEHTSELQSRGHLVCRLLLEKKKKRKKKRKNYNN